MSTKMAHCLVLVLFLFLAPTGGLAVECFNKVTLGHSTIFRTGGIAYSSCTLHIMSDQDFLWLVRVELNPVEEPAESHFGVTGRELEEHRVCVALRTGGMPEVRAIEETAERMSKVEKLVKSTLGEVQSSVEYSGASKTLFSNPSVQDFGVELKWNEDLKQAFYKILPSRNWESTRGHSKIVARTEWEKATSKPWCEIVLELNKCLELEQAGKVSVVFFQNGSLENSEIENRTVFEESLEGEN